MECLSGWNLLDFINFLAIMIFSIPFAATLFFITLGLVCCGPCLYSGIRAHFRQQAEGQQDSE